MARSNQSAGTTDDKHFALSESALLKINTQAASGNTSRSPQHVAVTATTSHGASEQRWLSRGYNASNFSV
eukprot:6429854-Amphidinium_carterae.1